MASTDYAALLTDLYDKLGAIQATLSKLALISRVNTVQTTLQASVNALTTRMSSAEDSIVQMKLTVSDMIVEMRTL